MARNLKHDMNTTYYIYCITSSLPEGMKIDITGLEEKPVTALHFKDIAALVSSTLFTRYEPNLENLQCHEKVSAAAMGFCTVLPTSFSTISKNEDDVRVLLEKYYDQFKENLARVEGKVELGIKVFCKLDYEKEDKIDRLKASSPREYMKKRYDRYQERKKQMDEIAKSSGDIHSSLSQISCESCISKPFRNNLIFNGAYLVEKRGIEKFSIHVEEMKRKYPQFKIIYSGPWSPYHFVRLIREGEENERYN